MQLGPLGYCFILHYQRRYGVVEDGAPRVQITSSELRMHEDDGF